MNTPNPLLPQGALPPRERSSLYFKILMIFAVHIVVLGGILMVGCNGKDRAKTDPGMEVAKADPMAVTAPDVTPAPPAPTGPALPAAPLAGGNTPSAPAVLPLAPVGPSVPAAPAALPPAPAATGGSVYVIAAGDTLGTIAKKSGVSVKAIEDANPGIDSKRLKIKAKLQIPASTATVSTDGPKPGADSTAAASGDSTIYIVKSGDILLKIAKAHSTTVKELEAMNDMKTASIKAGQKLKVPVMKVATADVTPSPATTPAPAAVMTPPSGVRAN